MRFVETELAGAFVIELEPAVDERGLFARTYCEREFSDHGLPTRFVQCSVSFNRMAGTTRGMHWQAEPHAEGKLVRCTAGGIFDVIVDLRPDSPTRHRTLGVELTARNRRMLFVPAGFAHGFQTLADESEISYQMTAMYEPDAARGFRWNDPEIGIAWPSEPSVMSERDRTLPRLSEIR